MKNVLASLDFDKHIANFKSGTKVVMVPLWSNKERSNQALTEKFTTKREEENTKSQSENKGYNNYSANEDAENNEFIVCLKKITSRRNV